MHGQFGDTISQRFFLNLRGLLWKELPTELNYKYIYMFYQLVVNWISPVWSLELTAVGFS